MDTHYQGESPGGVRTPRVGREGAPRQTRAARSDLQNRFIHALLNDIADQLGWPKDTGEIHTALWWKRRCTLQWIIDKKVPYELVTPLYSHRDAAEEEFGLLLPHTSDLNTAQCAELAEWIIAFGATNGVRFSNPKWPG